MKSKLALQLFTVRDESAKDYIKTLEKVAELGYNGVEFAGYYGLSADELKCQLDRLHLLPAGSHADVNAVLNNPMEVIAFNKTIGNKNIVIPYYGLTDEKSAEELSEKIKSVIKLYKDNGFTLCYHNHENELIPSDGKYPLEMLIEKAGKDSVKLEIDTYWAKRAGLNPADYLIKQKDNLSNVIHLKDGTDSEITAIGDGENDIRGIVETAERLNIEWIIVEDDTALPDGFTSAAKSIAYLKEHFNF